MAGEPNSDLSRPAAWRRPLQGNGRALPQRKDRLLMAKPATLDGYSDQYTVDCERVLVTLLRGLGPWKDSVYLVGGLTPRYLVAARPPAEIGRAHVELQSLMRLSYAVFCLK